ncbi:hypothetical protein Leryth_007601 [Lithospermum erythrorhizon]|nr:hypothetical protein Leryth_007601 [Lithospermum erythrorhizon]
MMKRKRVHHNRHPFDVCPFEVYWCDEWKEVDRLRISGGHITTHVVNDGETFEANIRMSSLRLRSRKATELDCTCFLRPGVDICVFTNSYRVDNSDEEKSVEIHDMENTDGEKAIENCVTDNSNGKKSVELHIIKNLDVEQSIVTRLIDNSDGEKSLEPHRMDISEEGKSIEPCGTDNLDEDKSTENSDEEAWVDAKIRSIKRKPHNNGCTCEFYVSFYHTQGPELVQNKLLHRDVHPVQLHQISIHQKLDLKPAESEFYRWGYSEDCSSLLKHKLFSGRFASDLSWLVVASVLKQTAFDVRSIQNKMVYEIFGDTLNSDTNECDSATSHSYAVNFKQDNDLLTPHVIEFGESSPKTESSGDIVEAGALVLYNPLELRRSKRRLVQPDRYLGCDDDLAEFEIDLDTIRIGAKVPSKYDEEEVPLALSVQADNGIETEDDPKDGDYSYEVRGVKKYYAHRSENKSVDSRHELHQLSKNQSRTNKSKFPLSSVRRTVQRDPNAFYQGANDLNIPDDPSVGIGDIISKYMFVTGSNLSKKKNYSNKSQAYTQKWTGSAFRIRRHRRTRSQGPVKDSIYDVRNYKKGSVSAAVYRELMKRCMVDIDASVNKEQPPIIDQWEAFKSRKFPNQNQHQEEPSMDLDEEASELDRLWKEMELALASCYLLDDHEQSQDESFGSEKGGKYCHHDYRLNEEVGVVCNLCGFVSIEIKNVSPSFLPTKYYTPNKEQRHDEVKELKPSEGDDEQFKVPAPSNSASTEGESEENVWALIPSLRHKLRDHQKKAFEFLWRNVAGSTVPTEMEEKVKKRGGCVISHTPGAGKTLLIITFLVSYLKLFPGSRPLVLAPKTTLYTWYKEIIKWEIPVPVYQIHGGQTYKGEILRQKMKLNPGLPRNQDVMHVLDCLEKIQLWLSHPSILLMGYTSFMTLMREDSNYAHRKYMAQVLRQCPQF